MIKKSFTLREMDFPPEVRADKRGLLKWFALSTGLISENESRTSFMMVFDALLYLLFSLSINPSTRQIRDHITKTNNKNISEKLVRYHLNRIISFGLVQRKKGRYQFNYSPYSSKTDLKAAYSFVVSSKIKKVLEDQGIALSKLASLYKTENKQPKR